MPKRTTAPSKHGKSEDSDTTSVSAVDQQSSHRKRKTDSSSLPFRLQPDAGQKEHQAGRRRHGRHPLVKSTGVGGSNIHAEIEASDRGPVAEPSPADELEPEGEPLCEDSNLSVATDGRRRQRLIHAPKRLRPADAENIWTFLGPGTDDPFSCLPTDLPQRYIDEILFESRHDKSHLLESKCQLTM